MVCLSKRSSSSSSSPFKKKPKNSTDSPSSDSVFSSYTYCTNCAELIESTDDAHFSSIAKKCLGTCGRSLHLNCSITQVSSARSKSKKRTVKKKRKKSSPASTNELIILEDGKCPECSTGQFKCFICNQHDQLVRKCSHSSCNKWYHVSCFKPSDPYILAKEKDDKYGLNDGDFICPLHFCLTCYVEHCDNAVSMSNTATDPLVQCIKCPTAYHHTDDCLAAGSWDMVTGSYIICPDHLDKKKFPVVNLNQCHVCLKVGDLVLCRDCPSAVHRECLEYDLKLHSSFQEPAVTETASPSSDDKLIDGSGSNSPSSTSITTSSSCSSSQVPAASKQKKKKSIVKSHCTYSCSSCGQRKPLLQSSVVWAKIGHYRWWPCIIKPIDEIPDNIFNRHSEPGEFCVQFLGSHDYYWLHKGRVFSYDRCDAEVETVSNLSTSKSTLVKQYFDGVQEAKEVYKNYLEKRSLIISKRASKIPPKYNKIKVNKLVGVLASQGRKFSENNQNTENTTGDQETPSTTSIKPTRVPRKMIKSNLLAEKCNCVSDDTSDSTEAPCSSERCVNRAIYIECTDSNCSAKKEECNNRRFRQRTYAKVKEFYTGNRGWGLKALEDIASGTFVIEYVGELITEEEAKTRLDLSVERNEVNYYLLTLDKNIIIDAGPSGNLARFMNHSCSPNCQTQKWQVGSEYKIGLFALRNISAGEELTFNYNLSIHGTKKTPCNCGAGNCSGFIGEKPTRTVVKQQVNDQKTATGKKRKIKSSKKAKKMKIDRADFDDSSSK